MRSFVMVLLVVLSGSALGAESLPPPPPPPPSGSSADELPPPPPPAPPSAVDTGNKHTHWAKPAAFIGFGVAGANLLFGIIAEVLLYSGENCFSEFSTCRYGAGTGLTLINAVLTGAAGPVVFKGGASARWDKGIAGSRLFRIFAWVAYGAALLADVVGALGGVPGFRFVGGAVGAGSLALFGLDALWSGQEADDVASIMTERDTPAFDVRPTVSFGRTPSGDSITNIGFAGYF